MLVLGEAELAADLISTWKPLWGGCASSRLDHVQTDGHGFRNDWEPGIRIGEFTWKENIQYESR